MPRGKHSSTRRGLTTRSKSSEQTDRDEGVELTPLMANLRTTVATPPIEREMPTVSGFRLGIDQVKALIPELSPSPSSVLTTQQWLTHVENLSHAYQWDDKSTLLYATLRLGEAAKYWHLSRDIRNDSWQKFKLDLLVGFPSSFDEASINAKILVQTYL